NHGHSPARGGGGSKRGCRGYRRRRLPAGTIFRPPSERRRRLPGSRIMTALLAWADRCSRPSSSRKAAEYGDAGRPCQFAPARPVDLRFGSSLRAGRKSVFALADLLVLRNTRLLSKG